MSRVRTLFLLLTVVTALYVIMTLTSVARRSGIFQPVHSSVARSDIDVARDGESTHIGGSVLYKVCHDVWNPKARFQIGKLPTSRRNECSCGEGAYESISKDYYTRRKKELEEWKRYEERKKEPFVVNTAFSPLSYPGSGLVVEPGMTIPIAPLYLHPTALECLRYGFHNNDIMINLTCSRTLGRIYLSLNLHAYKLSTSTEVFGNNTHSLQIILKSTDDVINFLLSHIHYLSVYYDIFARDVISVKVQNFTSEINVLIKRSTMPILYDPGPDDDIAGKVTIVTKTFERRQSIENLVKSIRKYYRHVTIVIADDSENPSPIHGDNIKYYIMPFAEGWFAGRNLVISQVRTKYFLWVDDDFEFTARTNLQKFINKLEDAEERLDVVAGVFENRKGKTIRSDKIYKTINVVEGDESGDCLIRNLGSHRTLKNYPRCYRSDIVINFFMAKTLSVKRIGFDPEYSRVGHTEFFIDGLGQLSVAICFDVTVKHARYKPEKYLFYRRRQNDPENLNKSVEHTLFKNNLKCFALH
ncbi:beta-1,4 N-acetylgalactosaminyltransferase 2-like [Ptychodera flava]|uniref:beta-1,4 N-acetylgalactosaminyltransferase 2-like n=1 Tax=Ptychodera flava TaxID=63121 RepID=UPI00396A9E0D